MKTIKQLGAISQRTDTENVFNMTAYILLPKTISQLNIDILPSPIYT